MIDTHYSLYRILPKRLINKISRRQKSSSGHRQPSEQPSSSQASENNNLEKGKNFDGYA